MGLSAGEWAAILTVLETHGSVDRAWVFGSRVTGGFRPGADLDLAVTGERLGLNAYLDLAVALEACWLPFRVDLVWLRPDSDPAIWRSVERTGRAVPLERKAA